MIRWSQEPVLDVLFAPRHVDGSICRHRGDCGQRHPSRLTRILAALRKKTA